MDRFRVRNKEVKLRCTEIEKLEIEKLASEHNMSINAYLLRMALEGCIINVDFSELKKLTYEINRIGNNINQIAYHVNLDHAVYQSDMEEVKRQMDLLWTLIRSELLRYK